MIKAKYKIDYDIFEKFYEINNMTFEDSKKFNVTGCTDSMHFLSMQLIESDLKLMSIAISLFEQKRFTLEEFYKEATNLWELGILMGVIQDKLKDKKVFTEDLEQTVKRCVDIGLLKKVG